MITVFYNKDQSILSHEFNVEKEALEGFQPFWVDIYKPNEQERSFFKKSYGLDLPSFEGMQEIEPSSRFYSQNNTYFATATWIVNAASKTPETHVVTFILRGDTLITLRYSEPHSFTNFSKRLEQLNFSMPNGQIVFIGLMESIVDRLADILERIGQQSDALAQQIFRRKINVNKTDLQNMLQEVGGHGDLTSKTRESLMSMSRLIGYITQLEGLALNEAFKKRLRTLRKDIAALNDHTAFLTNKITFLLDALLGLIDVEQNTIIKIFSMAAVIFLPPTLIASIYGMNFRFMPELALDYGYPLALILMLVSAILPYAYFKKKGWL